MQLRNRAFLAAAAALCTMFCAFPAHAEDDGDGGVYVRQSIAGASVSTAPVRTVPLSTGAIYPAQYNGDVRDLPQVYTPPEYHTLNDFPTPMPQRTPPPGGGTNAPQPPPVEYAPMPATSQNFAGLGFNTTVNGGQAGGGWPPDTNGDVGPTYYIQSVNTAYGIFNKSTGALVSAFKENQLWQGARTGTPCDANNQGDPIVIHDGLADRWILTNFAFTFSGTTPQPPYYQCIAVSKASDPVGGGWYLYAVQMDTGAPGAPPAGYFADYPKFGFWTDCLYMGANGFDTSGNYAGPIIASFDRNTLFSGAALTSTNSSLGYTADASIFGMFPANMQAGNGSDTSKLPPSGTHEYYAVTSASIYGFDVRKFQPGATACGSGATLSAPTSVSVASYGYPALPSGTSSYTTDIVRQPGVTSPKLDSLGDEIMQRVVYRNIAGTESLWLVHTTCGPTQSSKGVCSTSTTTTQPQWLQINVTGGTIATNPVQQQIYAPDLTLYRWMGSLAVDGQGNMAVGYSRSNATSPNYPSLAYAGRLVTDPLNQLPQSEVVMQAGAGSQTTYNRWGDYSAMTVDPSDDCTFWYTNEYYSTTGTSWQTRIGSFRFPGCIGTAAKLVFTAEPKSSYASNAPIAVSVSVEDVNGNVVTTNTSTVALTLSGGTAGATLGGTASAAAVNGVATFSNLTVNKVGTSYVLNATDGSLTGAASSPFNITVGAPATVSFTLEPGPNANLTAGSTIPLIAHVADSGGNPVPGDSVTLAIGNNAGGSTLSVASNPVTTDASGNASFSNVSLNKVGTGYTFTVSDGTAPMATSNSFNIVAGAASQLIFTTQPANVVSPSALNTIAVTEEDARGNTVTNDSTTSVNFTVSACGGTPLGSATMSNGVATLSPTQVFSTLRAGLTVSANDATLSLGATSQAFNVDNVSPSDLIFIDGFETCTL